MRTARRRAGLAAVTVTGALVLAGCVDEGRTSNPDSGQESACPVEVNEDITAQAQLAYQRIPNGDLVVRDQGWLEACMPNADITWSAFASGAEVVQAFASNTVDLGLLGSSPMANAVSPPNNLEMQVIWIHDVIGDAESLIAHEDSGVSSVEELTGTTVAVPFGSTAHFSLLRALQDADLMGENGPELINLAPEAMLAAWERSEIDAAWVWDPTLSELQESGSVILSSQDTAEAGTPTFDLAAATTAFIEENPDFMLLWTQLQDQAVQLIHDDPEQAADSIAVQLGTDAEQVSGQLEGYVYLDASEQAGEEYFGGKLATDLEATAEFLLSQREIDEVAPTETYEGAVYTDAVTEVGG